MSVHVKHNALESYQVAQTELADKYMFCTELDVPPVANAPHWHSFDAEFYILEGDLVLTDGATGQPLSCTRGSRVTVPSQTLHQESSRSGYRILLGTSVPPEQFGDPVDRPAATLP